MQSIDPSQLRPEEGSIHVNIAIEYGIITIQVPLSLHWPESFMDADFAHSVGLRPEDLSPSEIRRLATPRGWIRCTKAVVFLFSLEDERTLSHWIRIFISDEPGRIGTSMIIGRPWIQEQDLECHIVCRESVGAEA